jgi:hypothetical protein
MRSLSSLLVAGTLAMGAFGQSRVPLGGPVEGYIFDQGTSAFRAIVGRVGSSSLGPVLQAPFDFGSIAPQRDYGIATREGVTLLVAGLSSASSSATPLSGIISEPRGAAWSDDGTTLVLYSMSEGWIQIVSGLPAKPQVGSQFNVASLGGSLSSVAVSPRGEHVIFGLQGDTSGVFELVGSSFVPLMQMQNPTSFAFTADAASAFALDAGVPEVRAIAFSDRSVRVLPISDLTDPISIAIASGPSGSSGMLYIAGRRDQKLSQFDLSTFENISTSDLSFQPQGIQALGRGSFLFNTSRETGDPLWSFVVSRTPSIYFVPATPLGTAGGNQ